MNPVFIPQENLRQEALTPYFAHRCKISVVTAFFASFYASVSICARQRVQTLEQTRSTSTAVITLPSTTDSMNHNSFVMRLPQWCRTSPAVNAVEGPLHILLWSSVPPLSSSRLSFPPSSSSSHACSCLTIRTLVANVRAIVRCHSASLRRHTKASITFSLFYTPLPLPF
jgi:hypothetical protein